MFKTLGSTALSRNPGSSRIKSVPKHVRIHSFESEKLLHVETMIRRQTARQRAGRISLFIISLSLVIAVFGGILYRYSLIMEMNYENIRVDREIRKMEDETRLIREELAAKTDLRVVRTLALEQLYMQDPSQRQKIRVIVPRSDQLIIEDQFLRSGASHQDMNAVYTNLEGFFKKLR